MPNAASGTERHDVWVRQGYLHTTPGATVDYKYVAQDIAAILGELDVSNCVRPLADLAAAKEFDEQGISLPLVEFGQGFRT